MTKDEVDILCSSLEERGYKRYNTCLSSNESYGYFCSFKKNGEIIYQIEYRIWDYTKYGSVTPSSYGVDILVIVSGEDRNDMVLSYPRPFSEVEAMAKEFYELIKKI